MVMLQRWLLMEGAWSCYSIMAGEWSCYGGGQFHGGKHGHVTEVVTLTEGKRSCYRVGQCREGEWLCYRIGQFNGGRMVMLQFN